MNQPHQYKFNRFFGILAICLLYIFPTYAQDNGSIKTSAQQVFITDFETGQILLEKNAFSPMKPASMAKIMTIYIAFSRLVEGSLALTDRFVVSEKAWKIGGSRSFLDSGSSVTLEELLNGIIVQSGNDAAVALAEGISGTEDNFVTEMNLVAQKLGMKDTNFTNATGWPHPDLVTTARDLNILATALIKTFPKDRYPDLYPVFAKKSYTYNDIKQGNRNPLLYGKNASTNGVDGLKTGFTQESGYGLVASAVRGSQRVIMVLNGMKSKRERAQESRRLIDFTFREFKLYKFFEAGEIIDTAEVWLGAKPFVPLVIEKPLRRVMSRVQRSNAKVSVTWPSPVPAPVTKGQKIGYLTIDIDGVLGDQIPLIAGDDILQLGTFEKLFEAIKFLIFGATANTTSS